MIPPEFTDFSRSSFNINDVLTFAIHALLIVLLFFRLRAILSRRENYVKLNPSAISLYIIWPIMA